MNLEPIIPPFAYPQLRPCLGRIGNELSDFQVDEEPAYPATGEGQHWFVRVRKAGLSTPQLTRLIAGQAGVRERDIGFAGLKDKKAVATQWLSLLATEAKPPTEWQLPAEVQLLEVTRHDNKLRTGHLRGNRFSIRLVETDLSGQAELAPLVAAISERGLPNFFGAQRFGKDTNNLSQALSWLNADKPARLSRFLLKLYPSVIQSEIFNRYLAKRMERGFDDLLSGEVVRLDGTAKVFVVEDPEKELPRLASGDVHLTGPILGPKMRAASGEALQLEQETLGELGFEASLLEKLGRFAPGSRRDLLLRPTALSCQADANDGLRLEFSLPKGAYATQVVREFTRRDFGDDGRG